MILGPRAEELLDRTSLFVALTGFSAAERPLDQLQNLLSPLVIQTRPELLFKGGGQRTEMDLRAIWLQNKTNGTQIKSCHDFMEVTSGVSRTKRQRHFLLPDVGFSLLK